MSQNAVSVVCVTRNRRELLKRCLQSCVVQTRQPGEIVVVDNASVDGTVDMVSEEFLQVKLIQLHHNLGFFPALNIAIANTTEEFILTIDDDAYFMSDSDIERMHEAFSEEELDVVTCNIRGPRERPGVQEDTYVHTYKTGFSMIRRSVFESLGYYPDIFFRSAGESYVASKVWDRGRRVKQLANVTMYHDQALQGRSVVSWDFHGQRSQILLVLMRDPAVLVPLRLGSKFVRGFLHTIRSQKSIRRWAHSWLSALAHVGAAISLRDPVSLPTFRLLVALRSAQPASEADLERIRASFGCRPAEASLEPYVQPTGS